MVKKKFIEVTTIKTNIRLKKGVETGRVVVFVKKE